MLSFLFAANAAAAAATESLHHYERCPLPTSILSRISVRDSFIIALIA